MSDIDNGGQAFPSDSDESGCVGMTLRDYFAGQVIAYFIQSHPPEAASRLAYKVADYMIEVRIAQ